MRYYFILYVFIFCALLFAQEKELECTVSPNSYFTFPNKQITFLVDIKNNTKKEVKVNIVNQIPEEIEYVSSDLKTARNVPRKQKYAFLEWNVVVLAQSSLHFKIKMKAKMGTPLVSNLFFFKYLNEISLCEASLRIQGGLPAFMSSYDTNDPCKLNEYTTYVVSVSNEGTSAITNILLRSHLPKHMRFTKVTAVVPHQGKMKYKYDKKEHVVYFTPVAILQPGEKIVYRIQCKSTRKGLAKHRAYLKYDEYDGEVVDEEETYVYE